MNTTTGLMGNSRSMNGLQTINANTINTDNLTVGTLEITTAGTAPTITDVDDNTTSIATTAFVQNHLNLSGVTLDTTQTITGQKTFTQYITNDITPTNLTDVTNKNYVDTKDAAIQSQVTTLQQKTTAMTFTGGISNTNFASSLSTVNGATLGNGNDMSRIRQNLNVDFLTRLGYNDDLNYTTLPNNAALDVSGNIFSNGFISSASIGLIGNVDDTEFQKLNGLTISGTIQNQFDLTDASFNTIDTNLTGLTYTSGTDTTTLDNNMTISSGKNLLLGTTNVETSLTSLNTDITSLQQKTSQMTVTTGNTTFTETLYCTKNTVWGAGSQLTRIRRNINVEFLARIGVSDSLNYSTLPNNAALDVSGNIFSNGFISSSSIGLIGNVDNTEFQKLNGLTISGSIQNQFDLIDASLNTIDTNLTGLTYTSGTDTTTLDNNMTISSGKNLLLGTTNVETSLTSINTNLTGLTYNSGTDTTTLNNNLTIPTGNNLLLGSTNVLTTLNLKAPITSPNFLSGISVDNINLRGYITLITLQPDGSLQLGQDELSYLNGSTSNIQAQLNNTVLLTTNQNIAGSKTFTESIINNVTPTINSNLTNKLYVDTGLALKSTILNPVFSGTIGLNLELLTDTMINYISGLTSDCQTQLNLKSPVLNPVFSGTIGLNLELLTDTMINYISGLTSDCQTQLNLKANSLSPTLTTPTLTTATLNGVTTFAGNIVQSSGTTQVNNLSVVGAVTTVNGMICGNGNDLLQVRRNGNVLNVLRVGYADTTIDVAGGLSNDANIDCAGNTFCVGSLSCQGGDVMPTTNTGTEKGLTVYWNKSGGGGEVDYLCKSQAGSGGHSFYVSNSTTAPVLACQLNNLGNMILTGSLTTTSINSSGNANISGNTDMSGNLVVSGNTTLNRINARYGTLWNASVAGTTYTYTHNLNMTILFPLEVKVLYSTVLNPTLGTNLVQNISPNCVLKYLSNNQLSLTIGSGFTGFILVLVY